MRSNAIYGEYTDFLYPINDLARVVGKATTIGETLATEFAGRNAYQPFNRGGGTCVTLWKMKTGERGNVPLKT